MEFQVHEATTRDEFDAIIEVAWAALQEPFHPSFNWLHPVLGHTDADRVASMEAEADRFWKSHLANPASHWFYVTSPSRDGEVVGIAEWQVYTTNPFPNGPVRLEATWFPEGELREFASEYVNQIFYARMNWMNRPFVAMNAMAVIPSMRGHGIGTLLMEYGIREAERLKLECWTEASGPGRDLYEKFGFRPLMPFVTNMHRKNPSQVWKRLQDMARPTIGTLMWRPQPGEPEASFWKVMVEYANVVKDGGGQKGAEGKCKP